MVEQADIVVIGAGPAGLMAAAVAAQAGYRVVIAEAKPSAARKFLMAGKSGLNLTKQEPFEAFLAAYGPDAEWLEPMLRAFGPEEAIAWAEALGQEVFVGSTGRVFPTVMKASPLLRALLAELAEQQVDLRTRWRWTGWQEGALGFDTPDGQQRIRARATILAMGGASWARLGSDGQWADVLRQTGVALDPFAASNAGLQVNWSDHMAPLMGQPIKGVAFRCGGLVSRGEAVISERGLEGGGIYPLGRAIRDGAAVTLDLLPDQSAAQIVTRLRRPRGKASWSNHLRKTLKLDGVRAALLQEFGRPLPAEASKLAERIKSLPLPHAGLRPMDEAISTAGGVSRTACDTSLMLKACPGVFCAGEMLAWDAPTGGYLLTACLATGRWAGRSAADWVAQT
jgi:uncharacterized flavoprotein (TIGR03862 family)